MRFGVQFFPDVRPQQKSAEAYFQEALDLAEEADRLGYTHIRIVEHYFHYYGGYNPHPLLFFPAAAPRPPPARPGAPPGPPPPQPPPQNAPRRPDLSRVCPGPPPVWLS